MSRTVWRNEAVRKCIASLSAQSYRWLSFALRDQLKLEETHKQLVEASRRAGMADVATSVLHNVGNVLNCVNTSATLISDYVKKSKGSSIAKVAELLREHANDLGAFMVDDPKGQKLPAFLYQLAEHLLKEKAMMTAEADSLCKNVDHIKDIVAVQQSYGKVTVRVGNGGDKIRFTVIDNGVGIAGENLARIFTHGFTTKEDGHGFGLHASALAAKEMGGALTAQSDGPGKGATFTLELPWKPA